MTKLSLIEDGGWSMWSFSGLGHCPPRQLRLPFDLTDRQYNSYCMAGVDCCQKCGSWDTGVLVSRQDEYISTLILCNTCQTGRRTMNVPITLYTMGPSHLE